LGDVDNTGNNIITNGDTVEVAQGTYACNESGSNCVDSAKMLYPSNLYSSIECTNDSADCVIDGQSSRRVIYVGGNAGGSLTIRALTFLNGQAGNGGGAYIYDGAIVDVFYASSATVEQLALMEGELFAFFIAQLLPMTTAHDLQET